MSNRWKISEAKSKFSQVIDKVLNEGPQIITRNKVDTAVILTIKEFNRLKSKGNPSLIDLFVNSPVRGLELEIKRE